MTWSTEGMSRPRAATSVAIKTPLGEEANLEREDGQRRLPYNPTPCVPIQILQTLFLLQLRVQRINGDLEKLE